jgi:O-antigen ligase
MSQSTRSAFGLPLAMAPIRTGYLMLVIAAMAAGFLWSSGHDDQRCVELALLALLAPFMLARTGIAEQIVWMGRVGRCCLGMFFAIGAASMLAAFSLRHALYEWSILLLLLLAAAFLASELARAGQSGLQTVLRGVVVVGLLYSLRVILMYAAMLASGVQTNYQGLFLGFSNARFLNHVQTVLLPLVCLLYLQSPRTSAWRVASFALAVLWWAFLFLSEARATVLGLGAGCLFVFVLRRGQARSFLAAMALTALAGAVLYVLAFILLPMLVGLEPYHALSNVMQRTASDPTSRRNLLWGLALKLILAHPWLGIGPHHFAHEAASLSWGAHPHNFVFQIGAEWGLPALLCLLALIGLGMRGMIRRAARIAPDDGPNQRTLVVLLATGAAILVDGLFSGVLVMPQSQMAIMLYLACAAGWTRSLDNDALLRVPSATRWLASALTSVAVCGLAYALVPGLASHAAHAPLTPSELAVNPGIQWPRLWEAGYF